jgi:putative SOS response-associated peptidase YedK
VCGRFALFTPPTRVARFLDAVLGEGIDGDWAPSWNVPPTEQILGARMVDAQRAGSSDGRDVRMLEQFRWGLVPSWAKDLSAGNRGFNARAETVTSKPSFRSAFETRRMLIPADGFYEWQKVGTKRQPHFFERRDGEIMTFAGLWEPWRPAKDAPWVISCTIITTDAGPDMDGIHDRMPAVLEPDRWDAWLDRTNRGPQLEALLAPAHEGTLRHRPVGPRVGNVANNDPDLISEVTI